MAKLSDLINTRSEDFPQKTAEKLVKLRMVYIATGDMPEMQDYVSINLKRIRDSILNYCLRDQKTTVLPQGTNNEFTMDMFSRLRTWCYEERHRIAEDPAKAGVQLSANQGDWFADASKQQPKDNKLPSVENRAIAALTSHRDWNNRQIAEYIGCHPKSLTPKRAPTLAKAREVLKQDGRNNIPHGHKTKHGDIEAYSE